MTTIPVLPIGVRSPRVASSPRLVAIALAASLLLTLLPAVLVAS